MIVEILPFKFDLDTQAIASICLWALALYLAFSSQSEQLIEQLSRWMNFAERSLYTSAEEYEKTRPAREAQNTFYASLLSIVPFLGAGVLCNYGVELGLGQGWTLSLGILACVSFGVYELGRRS